MDDTDDVLRIMADPADSSEDDIADRQAWNGKRYCYRKTDGAGSERTGTGLCGIAVLLRDIMEDLAAAHRKYVV